MNHVPILVTAVLQFVLGAIWYSFLFAKPWNAIITVREDGKNKAMITGMISSLIGDLLVSFAMMHVILWSGAATIAWGMIVGFICWLGLIAAPMFPQGIYEGRPFKLFAINAGYWLIASSAPAQFSPFGTKKTGLVQLQSKP
jgi:hypothetical protein